MTYRERGAVPFGVNVTGAPGGIFAPAWIQARRMAISDSLILCPVGGMAPA